MSVIGIDLGGTKVAGAIFDAEGNMLNRKVQLLDGATGTAAGDKVKLLVCELLMLDSNISAIGVCVPGIVYSKKDTVWAPNIPGWEDFPLKSYIQEALGEKASTVEVKIESDRTCYILGEAWKGAAKGCNNAIYVAVGTGIGAGILIDAHVLHGANDIVGATGWMALERPYREDFIPCGCWEHYASGTGIGIQARKALRCDKAYRGVMANKPVEDITSYDVFDAYKVGDPIATKVLDQAIELWGMGAANLVSLFNPEKVIFGGGIFGPAAIFVERIYAEALKWGQPISMRDVVFAASAIDGNAALLGAAALALR